MFSVGMELEKAQNMVLLLSVNPESVEAGRASVQGFQGTSKEKKSQVVFWVPVKSSLQ